MQVGYCHPGHSTKTLQPILFALYQNMVQSITHFHWYLKYFKLRSSEKQTITTNTIPQFGEKVKIELCWKKKNHDLVIFNHELPIAT